jgi:arginine/ornithine N-succinyltransferase beta subunit
VCEHAPITNAQINSATAFWESLGYRFYTTQYKHDPLNKCLSGTPEGYILVRLVSTDIKLEESALAQTHFFVDNDTGEIDWAVIYMRNDIRKTVLEHELGHALGFLHYNKINHLMNEKWTMGGWDKNGLENKRR